MKNKFLMIAIMLVFYYSSKITAMEEHREAPNTNNALIKQQVNHYNTLKHKYIKSNINFLKPFDTDNLDGTFIKQDLPCLFVINNNNEENNNKHISLILPEFIVYSSIIYEPFSHIKGNLDIDNVSENIFKENKQSIKILLEKKSIKNHIKNSFTILSKKNLLTEQFIVNIEPIVDSMFTKDIKYISSLKEEKLLTNLEFQKQNIIKNRIHFIFFIIESLNDLGIKILKCDNVQNKLNKYLHNFKEYLKNFIEMQEIEKKDYKIIDLEINMSLFQYFLYDKNIIEYILNIKKTYSQFTLIENYILNLSLIKEHNLINNVAVSNEIENYNNNINNEKEIIKTLDNILWLLNIIPHIRLSFTHKRESSGGDPKGWGTYSLLEFDITKTIHDLFLINLLNFSKKKNLNNEPTIPYFKFFNKLLAIKEEKIEKLDEID